MTCAVKVNVKSKDRLNAKYDTECLKTSVTNDFNELPLFILSD